MSEDQIRVSSKYKLGSLGTLVDINKSSFDPRAQPDQVFTYVDVQSVEKGTGVVDFDQRLLGRDAPSRARRVAYKDNLIIATVRPNLRGFALLENLPSPNTVFSTGFSVLAIKASVNLKPEYLFLLFLTSDVVLR